MKKSAASCFEPQKTVKVLVVVVGKGVNRKEPNSQPTHLVLLGSEEEQVEGDGGDEVNEEPALEVVGGYLARMTDHLLLAVDVSGAEVDHDVYDEHDVHQHVHQRDRVTVPATSRVRLAPFITLYSAYTIARRFRQWLVFFRRLNAIGRLFLFICSTSWPRG